MGELKVYLAGAIRDGRAEDIEWRAHIIEQCSSPWVQWLNPLAGKHFDPETKMWSVGGQPSSASFISHHDKWAVEHSDICLFNFRALSQGYPNIGTLTEFGMAVAYGKLIYSIVDPDYQGHENPALYHLHPFLSEFSAVVLPTLDEATTFLQSRLASLSGANPWMA